ncbi:MAG: esterase-like activity of phytase family protein [Alphaproteobacteria bacterium]|nr:esterase-like activity of phytase family protein [Alphaproteobacteria bacterium]
MHRRRLLSFLIPATLVAALALGAASIAREPDTPLRESSIALEITATQIPFKSDDPAARRIGKLIWRGGLALKANSDHFGGWSDLHVTPDAKRLTSIADVGEWLTATIDYDKDGNLAGLSGARMGPLHSFDGHALTGKIEADSEGSARLPDGSWLVSFERDHRIWHYPTLDGRPTRIDDPPDIGKQPSNGGIETLTTLGDGTLIAISEEYGETAGTRLGWIGKPKGGDRYSWSKFAYTVVPDFNPTAIVHLPDEPAFVLLERAYDPVRGVRVRVMRLPDSEVRPGATAKAEELAFLVAPYAVDNLEGISAAKGPKGETLLWLISDDNFNPLQRNLLLMFELAP